MSQKEKKLLYVCFVVGDRHQAYEPFFKYFLAREYPEYDVKFYHPACQHQDREKWIKIMYWLYADPDWLKYDGVQPFDVDLFPVREIPPLLDYKLALCEKYNTPYYNTVGIDDPKTRGIRMTGIHFFKPREYLPAIASVALKYRQLLNVKDLRTVDIFYNPLQRRVDNQQVLYYLLRESGLPIITDASDWHFHGLHLGHSRCAGRWESMLANDTDVQYYWSRIKQYINDGEFKKLYRETIPEIRAEWDVLFRAAGEVFNA